MKLPLQFCAKSYYFSSLERYIQLQWCCYYWFFLYSMPPSSELEIMCEQKRSLVFSIYARHVQRFLVEKFTQKTFFHYQFVRLINRCFHHHYHGGVEQLLCQKLVNMGLLDGREMDFCFSPKSYSTRKAVAYWLFLIFRR